MTCAASDTEFKAKEIARGAEAVIEEVMWFGKKAIRKRRVAKGYRMPGLDGELRRSRTRAEARLLVEARMAGFPTPCVLDVDLFSTSIIMEFMEGPTLKETINSPGGGDITPESLCRDMGRYIGIMHGAGLVHGDLTTSNVIVTPGGLRFIDMGLGGKVQGVEDMGVDLHLVKEALESTHNHISGLFSHLIEGYRTSFGGAGDVENRMRDIEMRGRYS